MPKAQGPKPKARNIAQTVKRIEGPQKEEQRSVALKTIEKEIEKEPANPKTGKIETPAVKRVAEKAVTEVAGTQALPQVRAPRSTTPGAPQLQWSVPSIPGPEGYGGGLPIHHLAFPGLLSFRLSLVMYCIAEFRIAIFRIRNFHAVFPRSRPVFLYAI